MRWLEQQMEKLIIAARKDHPAICGHTHRQQTPWGEFLALYTCVCVHDAQADKGKFKCTYIYTELDVLLIRCRVLVFSVCYGH